MVEKKKQAGQEKDSLRKTPSKQARKSPASSGNRKSPNRNPPRAYDFSLEEIERDLTPLQKAQELIYDAWESYRKASRITLARKALRISLDCADAYVILAMDAAKTIEEELDFYQQGVLAGERALGPQFEKKYARHFWGSYDTRPYMRARSGLATSLWKIGRRREAIFHCQELLRLNPNDNQGIRYLLSHYLLEERQDKALKRLFSEYNDGSADWAYTRALWVFAREGGSKKATLLLKQAFAANGHVAAYLLGEKKIPKILPDYIAADEESEAFTYAAECLPIWQKIKGSLEWLLSASTIARLFEDCSLRSAGK